MARRVRLEQDRDPEDVARAAERPQAQPPRALSSPEAVLALQRTAGNQAAAAVLARMGNDKDDDEETSAGGIGAYLYSWMTYLSSYIPGRGAATTTATATAEPEAEVTAQTEPAPPVTTVVQTPTPTVTQSTTQQTQQQPAGPSITPPTPAAKTPISASTLADLSSESRKLQAKLKQVVLAEKAAREIRQVCHLIESVVKAKSITDAEFNEVFASIRSAWESLAKAPKAKAESDESSAPEKAASTPKALPVTVLYGASIGADPAGWGIYRGTVTKVIQEMRNGGVTLGSDFKPVPQLSVVAHWQQGEGQHFIKVQLDAADVGTGSVTRGYFRYKIFPDRLVMMFVAIRTEHKGGANTTLYGDHRDRVNADGT